MREPTVLSKPLLLFSQAWLNEIVVTLLATLIVFVVSFLILNYLQKRHGDS